MSRKSTITAVRTPVKLVSYGKVREVHARCTMKSKARLLTLIAGRDGAERVICSVM